MSITRKVVRLLHPKRICIVGFGSIGKRHASVLKDMVEKVVVVTSYPDDEFTCYKSIRDCLDLEERIDAFVICNDTFKHISSLQEVREGGFAGDILIEKPLCSSVHELEGLDSQNIYVGYNLRFHPLITSLKESLIDEEILSANIYAAQYLPTWRPDTDYRNSYSSSKVRGGGVLRDLSHEFDYAQWLFGKWDELAGKCEKVSNLEITSDDQVNVLISTKKCPLVNITLNYHDKISQRLVIVNTNSKTIKLDFVAGTIQVNGAVNKVESERNLTYELMHKDFLGNKKVLAAFGESKEVMELVSATELATKEKRWVTNQKS